MRQARLLFIIERLAPAPLIAVLRSVREGNSLSDGRAAAATEAEGAVACPHCISKGGEAGVISAVAAGVAPPSSATTTTMATALKDEEWINRLKALGQEQLIPSDATPQEFRSLFVQLQQADSAYPGGLAAYLARAQHLLSLSSRGETCFADFTASPPSLGERLSPASPRFADLEARGLAALPACAFVLVAGGLGERLGYDGIKIGLPCESVSQITFAELYSQYIRAFQDARRRRVLSPTPTARDALVPKRPDLVNGGPDVERQDILQEVKLVGEKPRETVTEGASTGIIAEGDQEEEKEFLTPLAIMTSDDTHEKTVELFEKHDFFGLKREQVTFMQQGKVPALIDDAAHLAAERYVTDEGSFLKLLVKPHGHGDVHTLLHQHNLVSKWKKQGIRWLVFFQDTNALTFRALPVALGVSATCDFALNTIAVPRKAAEAMGALCLLKRKTDGFTFTLNVEYNVLGPLLKAQGSGDVPNEAGMSDFPGNTNVLIFSIEPYCSILQRTSGTVPEFVNPKYKDDSKRSFKCPTRLECMMQDFPRLFSPKDRVGFTELERWFCYSPVKNNTKDAAQKAAQGIPSECALTGEADLYHCNVKLLTIAAESCGAQVIMGTAHKITAKGVHYTMGPRVVLLPSWATTETAMKERMRGATKLSITSTSTLLLEGDVFVKSLELDGAAILRADEGCILVIEHLRIKNQGWPLVLIDDDEGEPPYVSVRGFKFEQKETFTLHNKTRGTTKFIDDRQ